MSTLKEIGEKIVNKIVELGASEAEFYGVKTKVIETEIASNTVNRIVEKEYTIFNVRCAIGKRIGSYTSEDIRIESLDDIAKKLISITRNSPEDKDWHGFARGYKRSRFVKIFDENIDKLSYEDIIATVRNAIDTSVDSAIRSGAEKASVTRGFLNISSGEIYLINHSFEEISDKATSVTLYYDVKSIKNSEEATFTAYITSRKFDRESILKEAMNAGMLSVKFIGAKSLSSGKYDLLIMPKIMGVILSIALAPAFSALNIQQNRSPLKNKLGERVFSEDLNIYDDPYIEWGEGSRGFDDEGMPTSKKPVVEKGVFNNILYDNYTAKKEGRESTGNGFKRSISSPPQPSFTNFYLVSSNAVKLDNLIKDVEEGIIVYNAIGYWMSNPVNGGVQATVTHGVYVENGEEKYPVKGIVIGGNIYKWLKEKLKGVSKEIESVEDIYSPAILVEKADVAGK